MRRRRALQSLLGVPAAAALPVPAPAQQPQASSPPAEAPKLPAASPDSVAEGVPGFLSQHQLAALRRLAAALVPPSEGRPGAVEAGAVEFLDFLLRESPSGRQELYRTGLDRLNEESRRRYGKPFGEIAAGQVEPILAPLAEPRSYAGPADAFGRFLVAAQQDLLEATVNSREWAEAGASRRRGAAGVGYYWRVIE